MTLDLLLIIIVLAFTLVSYYTGILRQVLKLACVILSFFLSGPTSRFLCARFATSDHLGPITSYGVVRILSWLGLYVLLRIVAFYLNRAVGADKAGVLRVINRRLGAYLGFLVGVGLALVVLWSLQIWINDEDTFIFPKFRDKAAGSWAASWSQSSVAWRLASRYNPLIDYDLCGKLNLLRQAALHPQVFQGLSQDPSVKELLKDENVKALLKDEEFLSSIRDHDYIAALSNRQFKAMMSDHKAQELMHKVDFFRILNDELGKLQAAPKGKKKAREPGRKS